MARRLRRVEGFARARLRWRSAVRGGLGKTSTRLKNSSPEVNEVPIPGEIKFRALEDRSNCPRCTIGGQMGCTALDRLWRPLSTSGTVMKPRARMERGKASASGPAWERRQLTASFSVCQMTAATTPRTEGFEGSFRSKRAFPRKSFMPSHGAAQPEQLPAASVMDFRDLYFYYAVAFGSVRCVCCMLQSCSYA
jgi:hypothetical protein